MKNTERTEKRGGFTLIEILVVIAIISLLSSIVFASLAQARAKARDSKRVQDLIQLRNALELYKTDYGRYPDDIFIGGTEITSAGLDCWDCPTTNNDYHDPNKLAAISQYLDPRPADPSGPSSNPDLGYWYKTDSQGRDYKVALMGTVENIDNIPTNMVDTFFDDTLTYQVISVFSSDTSRQWFLLQFLP